MSTHLQPTRAAAGAPDATESPARTSPSAVRRPALRRPAAVATEAMTAVVRPRSWSRRWVAFSVLTVLYVALSVLILVPGTPVLHLDSYLLHLYLWHNHPDLYTPISYVVGFGQRWIMTYVLQVVFIWTAFRQRSIRPLVLFATAIVVLNVTVGVLKYALGRIGPILQDNPHDIFHLGGSIFPSGHVSNAVVLYGVLAWALPRYRRPLIAFAVLISVAVGLGTVFMRTHWFSDVMGGWIIGGMVLLFVPTVLPGAQRFADQLVSQLRDALDRHPRVRDRVRSVYHWGLEHIPADPRHVAPPASSAAGSLDRAA